MNGAFYIGALGLDAQQRALDVVANNIANINTNGFKRQTVQFSNLVSPVRDGDDAASAVSDAAAELSGVAISSTPHVWTQGSLNVTSQPYGSGDPGQRLPRDAGGFGPHAAVARRHAGRSTRTAISPPPTAPCCAPNISVPAEHDGARDLAQRRRDRADQRHDAGQADRPDRARDGEGSGLAHRRRLGIFRGLGSRRSHRHAARRRRQRHARPRRAGSRQRAGSPTRWSR